MNWRDRYEAAAARTLTRASNTPPVLTGFGSCIDALYHADADLLDRVAAAASTASPRTRPLLKTIEIAAATRPDGEICVPAERAELEALLGVPATTQIGGAGAQASWALAEVGAQSVLCFSRRTASRLGALHPDVLLCDDDAVRPASQVRASASADDPPHYILEFSSGTRWSRGAVPSTGRLIVRIADEGIDRDPDFVSAMPKLAPNSSGGLVAGLNAIPDSDNDSRDWVRAVVATWRDAELPIHLELADYGGDGALRGLVREYSGLASSIGMSLAELHTLIGEHDPIRGGFAVAQQYNVDQVVIHTEGWALVVHHGDPSRAVIALETAAVLASARAREGHPTAVLAPPAHASYTDDLPTHGEELGGGWRVDCVATPYLRRPAATVGLGDTFSAGLLLGNAMASDSASKRQR